MIGSYSTNADASHDDVTFAHHRTTASACSGSRYDKQHSETIRVGTLGSRWEATASVREFTSRRSAATSLYPPSSLYECDGDSPPGL